MHHGWRWWRAVAWSFWLVTAVPDMVPESLAADHLAEIRARGVLRWGADAEGGAPYVYPDPDNPEKLIGFEWDLAEALASRLGLRAEMVQNQWDQLIPALARGNFDIILNGLELTPENRERVSMSRPYYVFITLTTGSLKKPFHDWRRRGNFSGVLAGPVGGCHRLVTGTHEPRLKLVGVFRSRTRPRAYGDRVHDG